VNYLRDKGATKVITGISGACQALQVLDLNQNDLAEPVPCLLDNPISTLHQLNLLENPGIKEGTSGNDLQKLLGMYEEVFVDDDSDNNNNAEEDNPDVKVKGKRQCS
jgi:hypothetical protein